MNPTIYNALDNAPVPATESTQPSYPTWVGQSEIAQRYFEEEWGKPLKDERSLYELIVLFGFQTGLNWAMVLSKRDVLRQRFCDFDADKVAAFTEADIVRLVKDHSMIRNRRKITAAIVNARATVALRSVGGLAGIIWEHAPESPQPTGSVDELLDAHPSISALARALKGHGFVQIGPRSIASLAQALGMVPPVSPVG